MFAEILSGSRAVAALSDAPRPASVNSRARFFVMISLHGIVKSFVKSTDAAALTKTLNAGRKEPDAFCVTSDPKSFADVPMKVLLQFHNIAASSGGGRATEKFTNREAAVRRTLPCIEFLATPGTVSALTQTPAKAKTAKVAKVKTVKEPRAKVAKVPRVAGEKNGRFGPRGPYTARTPKAKGTRTKFTGAFVLKTDKPFTGHPGSRRRQTWSLVPVSGMKLATLFEKGGNKQDVSALLASGHFTMRSE